jgi:hypothetical protein
MSVELWVGSATTLAGAALGGVISFVLSRQQINESRRQRIEESQRLRDQSSKDRRLDYYSEFISKARSYRNAIRLLSFAQADRNDVNRIDELAAASDTASSFVFLVVESSAMYDACHRVLKAMSECQSYIHKPASESSSDEASIKEAVAVSLREFQVVSRDELGVGGVNASHIMGHYVER